LQNLFLPSVKLLRKERVGARVRRRYDAPRTPLDRVLACPKIRPEVAAQLQRLRQRLDPFALARTIEQQFERISALATSRPSAPSTSALPSLGPSANGSTSNRAPTWPHALPAR